MPTIRLETLIRAPVELCFDLSVDVDVHQASVSSTGERAVAGITSGRMALGDEVTWEARHLGRTRRLTSRITEFQRPTHLEPLEVDDVYSSYFGDPDRFPKGSVEFDCALVMRNIPHQWRTAPELYAQPIAAAV